MVGLTENRLISGSCPEMCTLISSIINKSNSKVKHICGIKNNVKYGLKHVSVDLYVTIVKLL